MHCYVCKKEFDEPHFHYKKMCKSCGDYNYEKRNELADLRGYVVVVTGGRVKIGYETALKFLRSNAIVIVTTRFPFDAAQRFSREKDFYIWKDQLKIYGIDFIVTPHLYDFVDFINSNYTHIDILINNAAQTVRPSKKDYENLYKLERESMINIDTSLKKLVANENHFIRHYIDTKTNNIITQNNIIKYGPLTNITNNNGLNSWNSRACDISAIELLEVQLINITAPFILATELRPLMEKSPHNIKYIVNVSAMEGKFNKKNKNCFHPHTNMCKAALNMLTRTSAQDYVCSGILMNSVDTGWITDENPEKIKQANMLYGITPPLDEKDGASRICDPIFLSINKGCNIYGKFLKNYTNTGW